MNIQEALKETGKTQRETDINSYAKLDSGILYFYNSETNEQGSPASLWGIQQNNWQPYHLQKEIVPTEAGELWENKSGNYGHTFKHPSGKIYFTDNKDTIYAKELIHVIHNQNDWTRIHPPVEE